MDYFARDMKRTLGAGQVNFMLIEEAFVAKGLCGQGLVKRGGQFVEEKCCRFCLNKGKVGEHLMLCWPEKDAVKAMEFFKTR